MAGILLTPLRFLRSLFVLSGVAGRLIARHNARDVSWHSYWWSTMTLACWQTEEGIARRAGFSFPQGYESYRLFEMTPLWYLRPLTFQRR